MRSIWRTLDPGLARDIALVCLADGVVGLSYGAISVGGGLPLWVPVVLSLLVFAGASQFLFVGIVAAGGSPIAATIAGLLVNSRHVAFGLAVSDVIGNGWRRPIGSHLMTDENVAFGLDAAFPAVLLALLLPSLRDKSTRTAALAGAVVALAVTPFLPAGLPVLLALVGLLFYRAEKPALEAVG
jgi:predicted branched-subunit amino acid permease